MDVDLNLVRCPLGHGLFLAADPGRDRGCPACGAPLLAVLDDHNVMIPSTWPAPIPFALDSRAHAAALGSARIFLGA